MEFAYVLFGATYLGARVTFVEAEYNEDQMSHTIDETFPKIVFCSYTSVGNIRKLSQSRSFIEKIILFGENWDSDGVLSCNQWLHSFDIDLTDEFTCKPVNMKETVSIILRTSGTTKMPKNILVTQTNMILSSILYK